MGSFPPVGHLATFGDILVVTCMGVATGIQWIKIRDDGEHLTMHRTVPHNKTYLAPKYQ